MISYVISLSLTYLLGMTISQFIHIAANNVIA